jgi:hypothetical protein
LSKEKAISLRWGLSINRIPRVFTSLNRVKAKSMMKEFHPERVGIKCQGVHGLDNRTCHNKEEAQIHKRQNKKKMNIKERRSRLRNSMLL